MKNKGARADRGQHPQEVHRKGRQIRFQSKTGRRSHRRGCTKGRQSTTQQAACGIDTKGLITKSGNLLLNKLSAKLTQPQQHTQAPLLQNKVNQMVSEGRSRVSDGGV
jgi:hypothetical protein